MADKLKKMWSEMDYFTNKLLKGEYVSCPDLEELKPPEEAGARASVSVDTGLQQIDLDVPAAQPEKNKVRSYKGDDSDVIQSMEELMMTSSEEELNSIMDERKLECKYELGTDNLYSRMSERCQPVSRSQSQSPPLPTVNTYITTHEQLQIESLYRGLKTKVFVCSCAANLYFSSVVQVGEWEFQQTGVPVVVTENKGATNTLWLYLAELGTGLPYWKDILDFNSSYSRSDTVFHHWRVSWDRKVRAGLSFDSEGSASSFWLHICCMTSRLENIGVSLPKTKSTSHRKRKSKSKPISKSQISNPCCFAHITSIRPPDRERFRSLQSFVAPVPPTTISGEEFQESVTTRV